ncbi:MAG: hypothetical protein KF727_00425 [Microbacteriaceae bacterium]|nr:hypothetical protein [Microbacteriaceae bacterium]
MSARARAGAVGIAVRSATTSPLLTLFAFTVVAVTAFIGAATPGFVQRTQTESLRFALERTAPAQRDFVASVRGTPEPGAGRDPGLPAESVAVWGGSVQGLLDASRGFDPALAEVLGRPRIVSDLDPAEAYSLVKNDGTPRSQLTLRYDPEYSTRVRFVEGRAPQPVQEGPLEFGLSTPVAQAMGWEIGAVRTIPRPGGIVQSVVLTGVWEPVDASDRDWDHAPTALAPGLIEHGLELPVHTGVGYAAPADLGTAAAMPQSVVTTLWYPLEVPAVDARHAGELAAAMRLFSAVPLDLPIVSSAIYSRGLAFTSTAPLTITQGLTRIESMTALVALIATGPLAVAIVVLALATRMIALRRRPSLRLAEARGASTRLRAGVLAAEGLAIGATAGAAGGVAGMLLGGGDGPVVALVPALAALTPVIALPATGLLVAKRRARADAPATSPAARRLRLLAELALVAVAATATVLVVSGARSVEGVDPLVVTLPLLLAAVGCVLTLRLVPFLLALVERGSPRRRGLLGLIGPARAHREPALRVAPVLAVVVGVAIAVFSSAFAATVGDGIVSAARGEVGADVRISARYLNADQLESLARLSGVAAVAPVYADEQSRAELPSADLTVMVYVIDVAELRRVQEGDPSAIALPDALLETGGAVPVVASQQLADRVGDETLVIEGRPVDIVGTAVSQTPLGSARTWVAVDRSRADELLSTTFSPSTVLLDLEPGADPVAVAEQARLASGTGAVAATPASVEREHREDPALSGLQLILLGAIVAVAALLALAVGMTLVLGAASRDRMLALLSALGLPRRREPAIVVWEVAPAVIVALPVGVLAGLALPFVVVPALDLTGFVGGELQPAVHLGAWTPLVVPGFLAVTILAVLVAAFVARRVTAARTLRSIDEEG